MTDQMPSDFAIRKKMKELVPTIDINGITIKQFMKMLSKEMGANLKEKKQYIRDMLTEILDEMDREEESGVSSDEESGVSSDEESEDGLPAKPKTTQKASNAGFQRRLKLSPELAAFLGRPEESRPQVVKLLWKYFKENELQNPDDKRQILLDDKLKAVFKVDMFTMFTLNKYVGAHIHPFKPVDLNEISEKSKKKKKIKASGVSSDEESEDGLPSKPKTTQKANKGTGRGFQAKLELSPELAAFLGRSEESRPQVVKLLWKYFKENELQNPDDKRQILLDDKLKAVFKVDMFTMFTLNKYVGAHIHPFKPVNLSELSEHSKKKKEENKKRKAAQAKNGTNKRRVSNQPVYILSADLAAVAKTNMLPRPQITKALWGYVKENNLQNPEDKREIICDEQLKRVMGGQDKVTMFSMNKYISKHLLGRAEKGQYVHKEKDSGGESEGESDKKSSDEESD